MSYIGCHVSIRHGFAEAAKLAKQVGGNAFQYFPKNPRALSVKQFNDKDAEACAVFCKANNIVSIAHTPYPTNLAIGETEKRQAVLASLLNDLQIAEACGSLGVVVHFGVYKGDDTLQGYKNILQLLNDVTQAWKGSTLLLIENQAGEGSVMGTTIEEMMKIRSLCNEPERIGFCLDTCHAFASGLWRGKNWERFVDTGNQLGYFEHVKAIHLNDSVYPCGARKDRHANIGKGYIGEQAFIEILHSSVSQHIPLVLETPTSSSYNHVDEIRYVQHLALERISRE